MSNTKVTLYHADWCGHCKHFLPKWDALTSFFTTNNISYENFEDQRNPVEIENAGIKGFPTIRITKDDNEYEYTGERTVDAIINEVLPQSGGNVNNSKRVYIKYTKNI